MEPADLPPVLRVPSLGPLLLHAPDPLESLPSFSGSPQKPDQRGLRAEIVGGDAQDLFLDRQGLFQIPLAAERFLSRIENVPRVAHVGLGQVKIRQLQVRSQVAAVDRKGQPQRRDRFSANPCFSYQAMTCWSEAFAWSLRPART